MFKIFLSQAPAANWTDDGRPDCYYKGFRDEEGNLTPVHWYILTLKFAFVIIFEHFVFGVCKLIDVMVPDIPYSLDIKIKRERYLAKQALQVNQSKILLVLMISNLNQDADHGKAEEA